ncbi:MAG: DUF6036 family nucleotidyltransferase [Ruminococcus sp.]
MNLHREEIINRLLQVDKDMSLLDTTSDIYSCVIVGGSALVLMKKIYRSTHDIDSIDASNEIKPLLETYNINMNVKAYRINFPEDYLDRIIEVDIPTTKVKFYTVSLEDIVVSKLCGMREKDVEDIENELVYKDLNWKLLDDLIEEVCYGMLNDFDVNVLKLNYRNYKEKFR